jgi:DNA-binding transcriptional MocR family regulator
MDNDWIESEVGWSPAITKGGGPLYSAIADAIAHDIRTGLLKSGTRLPTQRALAATLRIDVTTVCRGYAEARKRGLVEGRVGQGTYVLGPRPAPSVPTASGGEVDMSMNLPPRFDDPDLTARLWAAIAGLEHSGGLDLLLRYQEAGGTVIDRATGARWLRGRIPDLGAERVLIAPGAQGAFVAAASLLAEPGETICTGTLTYPAFRTLATQLRIRLVGVPLDAQGLDPDAFETACRKERPKALYCTPTLHNPTAVTMTLERREAVIAIARRHGVTIIEDDTYGALPRESPPPIAALAPELTCYVGGIAKCLSPALRIAYVVPPDSRFAGRLTNAIRATATMTSPLSAAIATRWIETGLAAEVLSAIRREAEARQSIAAAILPPGIVAGRSPAFHLWLPLPAPWTRAEFAFRLRTVGIGVVPSDAFALGPPPEALRLALGAAPSREDLRRGLTIVANLLEEPPILSSMVV